MAIIRANQVGKSFGAVDLFAGVSVSVPHGARIGVVGPNGVGKTTLLLILAGLADASHGQVFRARGTRVGYLPQEAATAFEGHDNTVIDEMLAVFADLRAREADLEVLAGTIARGEANEDAISRYGALLEQFELAGGYTVDLRVRQVLTGLGFDEDSAVQRIALLSGGQKTRALLARLLLEQPDVLMLDEPTNHLDIAAIEWLEGFLTSRDGALLVVSHDRYFLDRVVDSIWELGSSGIELYRGNYSAYVNDREARWALRRKQHETFMAHAEKELDFIRRNIAAQQTSMALGKLARLGREIEAVHAGGLGVLADVRSKGWARATGSLALHRAPGSVEEVADRLAQIRSPDPAPPAFRFSLQPRRRGGDLVLRTFGLRVGYPGHCLFLADDVHLVRGERAAVMGGNGTGKTTFLRTILGEIEPIAGDARVGANLDVGYFPQSHDYLDPANTVLDELLQVQNLPMGEARGYLAQFLFPGDDAYKRIEALSGGERARLALALLALRRPNLLLLDEPTNHLDLPAQDLLQAVLQSFDGTIVMVSHDRYLVDRLATQLWLIEGDRLRVFRGTYREYVESRDRRDDSEARGAGSRESPATQRRGSEAPLSKNERRRREERLAALETLIVQLEADAIRVGRHLQAAGERGDLSEIERCSAAYQALSAELETAYAEWSLADEALGA